MTRENPLTHHEKLRYDYLLKNIHYLNDKEKSEFAFYKLSWMVNKKLVQLS